MRYRSTCPSGPGSSSSENISNPEWEGSVRRLISVCSLCSRHSVSVVLLVSRCGDLSGVYRITVNPVSLPVPNAGGVGHQVVFDRDAMIMPDIIDIADIKDPLSHVPIQGRRDSIGPHGDGQCPCAPRGLQYPGSSLPPDSALRPKCSNSWRYFLNPVDPRDSLERFCRIHLLDFLPGRLERLKLFQIPPAVVVQRTAKPVRIFWEFQTPGNPLGGMCPGFQGTRALPPDTTFHEVVRPPPDRIKQPRERH